MNLELPFASGVLYAPPNPDGSKKLCENCAMFVEGEKCMIHSPKIRILPSMVCGYHVYGQPGKTMALKAEPIDPKLSGLEDVSETDGTNCGTCVYFTRTGKGRGMCHGVAAASGNPPQPVQEMGCCARWERP